MIGHRLIYGDFRDELPKLAAGSVDAIVSDPPYDLKFMGKKWDSTGVAFRPDTWEAAGRVLRPGGYLLAFGGTRTYHRMVCAIEDAGFDIRDSIHWIYGTGFPKAKSCLKPAHEPIVLAWKPARKAAGLQINACRVSGTVPRTTQGVTRRAVIGEAIYGAGHDMRHAPQPSNPHVAGRWPPNLLLVHSPGCRRVGTIDVHETVDEWKCDDFCPVRLLDRIAGWDRGGGPSRFYPTFAWSMADLDFPGLYVPKASKAEREAGFEGMQIGPRSNNHPTLKPLAMVHWLCRLITPPGGTILDPFVGSGTTILAARSGGFSAIGIDNDMDSIRIAEKRLSAAANSST